MLEDSLAILKDKPEVLNQEKDMILSNKKINANGKTTSQDLTSMSDFFRNRLSEIELLITTSKKKINTLNNLIKKKSQELQNLQTKNETPHTVIDVEVESETPTTSNATIKYFVEDASWSPTYNTRIFETNKPIQIESRAKIKQKSGEDWENVILCVSTENPFVSNDKPILSVYKLPIVATSVIKEDNTPFSGWNKGNRTIKGVVLDADGELPGANVIIKGTNRGMATDLNGEFTIEASIGESLLFSFIGYENQEVKIKQNTPSILQIKMKPDNRILSEVIVCGYGVTKKSSDSTNKKHTLKETELNQTSSISQVKGDNSLCIIDNIPIDPKKKEYILNYCCPVKLKKVRNNFCNSRKQRDSVRKKGKQAPLNQKEWVREGIN